MTSLPVQLFLESRRSADTIADMREAVGLLPFPAPET